MRIRSTALAAALFSVLGVPASAQDAPRLFISADMEGIAASVTAEQLGPQGFEYERFREIMTEEVLAAVEGARAAGAGEILVADSHGNMQNLLVERLPADIAIVRGRPRPLMMMAGIDEGRFDGAIFIGYHASASNPRGVRAHTFSSARLSEVKLNGTPASEGYFNAAVAGHFDVPVILVSGDDAAVEELQARIEGVEGAIVKWNRGFHAARTLTPAAARDLIRRRAQRAVARLRAGEFEPFRPSSPVTMDITFHFYRPAAILTWLDRFDRTGARSVRFEAEDMREAARTIAFMLEYSAGLEP